MGRKLTRNTPFATTKTCKFRLCERGNRYAKNPTWIGCFGSPRNDDRNLLGDSKAIEMFRFAQHDKWGHTLSRTHLESPIKSATKVAPPKIASQASTKSARQRMAIQVQESPTRLIASGASPRNDDRNLLGDSKAIEMFRFAQHDKWGHTLSRTHLESLTKSATKVAAPKALCVLCVLLGDSKNNAKALTSQQSDAIMALKNRKL